MIQVADSPTRLVLERTRLFRELSPSELERLADGAQRRQYRAREALYRTGDPGDRVYVIESGHVKVVLEMADGAQRIIDILGPGQPCGVMAIAYGAPHPYRVETFEPVQAVSLPVSIVAPILQVNPRFAHDVLSVVTERLHSLTEQFKEISLPSVASRVAARLVGLANRYGREVDASIEIDIPFVQQDLAEMIGANRSTVNQWLGWYEDRGAIVRRNRRIVILEIDYLRSRAR